MYSVLVHTFDVSEDQCKLVDLISYGPYDRTTALAKQWIVKTGYEMQGWKFEDLLNLGKCEVSEEKNGQIIVIGVQKEKGKA